MLLSILIIIFNTIITLFCLKYSIDASLLFTILFFLVYNLLVLTALILSKKKTSDRAHKTILYILLFNIFISGLFETRLFLYSAIIIILFSIISKKEEKVRKIPIILTIIVVLISLLTRRTSVPYTEEYPNPSASKVVVYEYVNLGATGSSSFFFIKYIFLNNHLSFQETLFSYKKGVDPNVHWLNDNECSIAKEIYYFGSFFDSW